MKTRWLLIVAVMILGVACSEYSCPTYGTTYSYTPTKQRVVKTKYIAPKKVRRAEVD